MHQQQHEHGAQHEGQAEHKGETEQPTNTFHGLMISILAYGVLERGRVNPT
jgi:hypothetical protein